MEHTLTRRLIPIMTVGAIALTVVSCGSRQSIMDSISANEEYLAAVAELEASQPSSPRTAQSTAPAQPHNTPSQAAMTPFPFESVNDAPWPEIFNDSNKYQYPFAEKLGIKPIHDIGHAYFTKEPIVLITPTAEYDIDTLTHSVPYLVPRAQKLLSDIGADFRARLKKQGIQGWRIRVTSLLRTPASVKKLRRVNINAADSSAHQFATTFDLSYLHFRPDAAATPTTDHILKQALAETLFDFRKKERCMIKYESKTHCFHITVTK